MRRERRRCAVSCILVVLCLAQTQARHSRRLSQTAFGIDSSGSPVASDSSTEDYFCPHWGAAFKGTGSPTNQNVWAPAANPENSSAIFYMVRPGEIRYTISLQAVLAPGDQVQQVVLAGSISNDTGERPVVAYLFGVDAMSLFNQSGLGMDAPAYAANGQAPWQIASGVIYPEDITDDSPYLFSELTGRFTGSYSGYNEDPLFVTVQTTQAQEAFVAGIDNGIKPLNAAALQYVDQDTIDVSDTSSSDSSISGEGTGGLTASGGNAASTSDQSSGGTVAAASIAAPAAGPASNLSASTVIVDPALANGTAMPAAAPDTSIVASSGIVGPAASAPASGDSSAAVAYGASSFHVDLSASPGVDTNATGLVMFFLSPMESSMHYRMYVRGLSPYALIQNVTFFATDGPNQSGIPRLILTKAFGLPNGPANPTGGFGVPANGTTWVLTTGNSPDETVLSVPGNGDLEMSRYRQFSNALRYNKLRVHVTTVVHPDGLLDGVSAVGASKGNWPVPSW